MTKIELAQEQLDLMNVIRAKSNINIVTCGNCGTILFHEMKSISDIEFISFKDDDNSIECFGCNAKMELCDCPDLWYEGCIENMEFDEDEPIISSEFFILPSIEDVVQVAIDLKMNPSIAELKEVLKYYPSEVEQDPTATWDLIVENMLYNYVQPPHTK
jgi:hypothetical protein